MCSVCDCQDYIKQGKEVTLRRVVELVQKLGVTSENTRLFEDGEYICGIVSPMIAVETTGAEVWDIVRWHNRAHERINEATNRAALAAVQDVFHRIPSKNLPKKEAVMLWHQLEQLEREVRSEAVLSTLDPSVRAALEAVSHVHDNSAARKHELEEQYQLS